MNNKKFCLYHVKLDAFVSNGSGSHTDLFYWNNNPLLSFTDDCYKETSQNILFLLNYEYIFDLNHYLKRGVARDKRLLNGIVKELYINCFKGYDTKDVWVIPVKETIDGNKIDDTIMFVEAFKL